MNTIEEENYVFFRTCENDFRVALKSYELVDKQEYGFPQLVYLRDSVISYGRPFSANKGFHSSRHKLKVDIVPTNYLSLHKEIMRLRDTLFAHSDIKERNPSLSVLGDREDEIFVIESEPVFLSDVKENLKGMASLIEKVHNTVEQKRKRIEEYL